MVLRRCPQCGSTCDDQYGFCIKCGFEFQKVQSSPNQCPLCGFENPDEADFCVKCGSPLIFKNQFQSNDISVRPIVINKTVVGSENSQRGGFMKWLIIFGYLFSILGGLLGFIIAIYLITRKDPSIRKHGIMQLAILLFYILIVTILYFTGAIPAETITQYRQLLAGNFTFP